MKSLKKLLILCLVAAMLVTLASCGAKKLSDTVAGSWAAQWDVSDLMAEFFLTGMAEGGLELDSLPEGTSLDFVLTVTLDLNSDGTYKLDLPQDALDKSIAQLTDSLCGAIRATMEAVFKQQAEEFGVTLEELYALVGCADLDELILMSMGTTLEDFVDELCGEMLDKDSLSITEDGTFTAKDSEVVLTSSDGSKSTLTYAESADTLTVTEEIEGYGAVTFVFTRQ